MRTHFGKCKGPKEECKKKKCSKHKASKAPSSDKPKESHHKSKTKKDKAEKADKHAAKEKKPRAGHCQSLPATTASPEHNSGTACCSIHIAESNSPQKKSKKHTKKLHVRSPNRRHTHRYQGASGDTL